MRYESTRDVELRLKHTVVMHKERPSMVMEVRGQNDLVVQDMLTGRLEETTLEALDLEPSHAPLGYVKGGDGHLYLATRKPARKFKQGLSHDTLHIKPVFQKRPEGRIGRAVSYNSKNIARTILNQYDSVGKAFQKVRGGEENVVPFSRDWAVGNEEGEICLVFRGEVVGYCSDTKAILLPERFYLEQSLGAVLK